MIKVQAILDCGSSKTIASDRLFLTSKYSEHFKIIEFPDNKMLCSALVDSHTKILGKVLVNLHFTDINKVTVTIPHEVYVVSGLSLSCEFFLGFGFIRSNYHVYNTAEEMVIQPYDVPVKNIHSPDRTYHTIPIKHRFFFVRMKLYWQLIV